MAEKGRELLAGMEAAESVESELRQVSGDVAGTLRIAASQALPFCWSRWRSSASRRIPEVRVALDQAEPEVAEPALLAGDFDLFVAELMEHGRSAGLLPGLVSAQGGPDATHTDPIGQ